jgi:hypothetical protein
MGTFIYVYVLQSEIDPSRFYTGYSEDLRRRLTRHNRGEVPHNPLTSTILLWQNSLSHPGMRILFDRWGAKRVLSKIPDPVRGWTRLCKRYGVADITSRRPL